MTVAATITAVQPLGNGSATQFSFPNKVFQASDLVVTLFDLNGAQYSFVNQANVVLGLSYTVQNVDVDTGCLVVFNNPPTLNWTVDIRTQTPQIQSTSIKNQGAFLPELHEEAFDRVTREIQDLLRQAVTFSIHAQDIEAIPWPAIPPPSQRGGLQLIFDPVTKLPTLGVPNTQVITTGLLAPFLGLGQTNAEIAAGVTPTNLQYPPLNVKRYGAAGDGVTDDTLAVNSAIEVAEAQGGGTIVFPNAATYLIASLDPTVPSVNLPQQQANGSQLYQPYQVQLYLQNASNIVFDFQGSTLKSTLTGGGAFMLLDGCSNIRMLGPKITGPQVMSTGVVGLGAITGGSGYTNGTYNNVILTGGSGGGAVAGIVVAGGAVTSVTISYAGGNYALNDVLSAAAASIGGTGSGFSVPVTSITGQGPVVLTAAPNAIVVTALSQPSANITITDLDVNGMYTGLYCVDDPTTANLVSHVSLLGYTRVQNAEYGVALHNAGDDTIIENLYTFRANRPFFFYGVQNVNVTAVGDQVAFGFQPVVKSYSRSCRNIAIKYAMINAPGQSGSVSRISFQVQCDPAVISPPPTLQQVYLDYDEANVSGNGGNGIEFDYFAGAGGLVQQSSSTNLLFNNFILRGFTNSAVYTTVALSSAAAQCQINYDQLQFVRAAPANDPNNNNGFIVSRKFTYTPAINWGGANTGWTFSTQTADYYIQGGLCTVIGTIIVTAKGSATGAVTIAMPFPTRADSSRTPLLSAMGSSGFASLAGPIIGFIASGTATANLLTQGAASTSTVTDGNFAPTSTLLFQASFPL